jgi:type II secretion system protein J
MKLFGNSISRDQWRSCARRPGCAAGPLSRKRQRGFTLLELLVAMAMVAILAVSLYASIQITFKAQKRAEAAVEPARSAQLALEMIGQDLTNSLQPGGQLAGNFEGTTGADDRGHEADDIDFYATTDSPQHQDANGEIKNIEITVITPQNSSDHVLVRRVTRNLLSLNSTASPDPEFICGHVNSFTVAYYDGTDWETSWDSTAEDNTLPVAIQVTLNIDRDDAALSGGVQTTSYTRVFPLPCSTAEFDSAVNPSATSSTQ